MNTANDKNLKDAIEAVLNTITDPGSGAKLGELGLIRDLEVKDGIASLTFRPSSTVCPIAFSLAPKIKDMVEGVTGVRGVEMHVENFNRAEELSALLE